MHSYKMKVSSLGWLCAWRKNSYGKYSWLPICKLTDEQVREFVDATQHLNFESYEAVKV